MTNEDYKEACSLLKKAISYLPGNSAIEADILTFLSRVDPVYMEARRQARNEERGYFNWL